MFKSVQDQLWAFDCEWVPDPLSGRVLYGLPPEMPDAEVVGRMWREGGATAENPMPFLRTVQCRVISIAAVRRLQRESEIRLDLLWLPRDVRDPAQTAERTVIGTFLQAVGRHRPQLVGFNSRGSDLKILVQRGVVAGIAVPEFCRRPDKPWEGVDYFARENDWNVDLMEILGGRPGAGTNLSLNEVAALAGIPGKFEARGEHVARMWLDGRWQEIVQYNCFDALTTYLVWLRLAHFAGALPADRYDDEQQLVRELIMTLCEKPETAFLERYFDEWERLQALTGQA
jgi:predicted PolB exonuclease-like 3'-5' exonuclease